MCVWLYKCLHFLPSSEIYSAELSSQSGRTEWLRHWAPELELWVPTSALSLTSGVAWAVSLQLFASISSFGEWGWWRHSPRGLWHPHGTGPDTQRSTQSMRAFSKFQGQHLSIYLNRLYGFSFIHWTNVSLNPPRCCSGAFIVIQRRTRHNTHGNATANLRVALHSLQTRSIYSAEFKVLRAVLGT